MEIGTVYKSTGSWYTIKDNKGNFRQARLRGKHKIDTSIRSTNPIAIGDKVKFTKEANTHENNLVIESIEPRENYVIRSSPHNKHLKHIIAANIDQAILLATLVKPRTSQGFIDRFLITCEMYHIPAIIIFNKMDLYFEKEMEDYNQIKSMYEEAGYTCYLISLKDNEILPELKKIFDQKTTLLSGHSGVGKSTFLNALHPLADARIGDVSFSTGKGMHTTTFAEMYDIANDGNIIDTPGIKEFGLVDVDKSELAQYFPEFRKYANLCKYSNCKHLNEPQCAVLDEVQKGNVSVDRYESYLSMLDSLMLYTNKI